MVQLGRKKAQLGRILEGRMLAYAAAPVMALAGPQVAQGAFVGTYDVSNWTTTLNPNNGDGSVDTSGAPNAVTVIGGAGAPNNGPNPQDIDFTITVTAAGTWSFSWAIDNLDSTGYDFGGYLLNGVFALLGDGTSDGSGSESFAVNTGDVIGFRVNCSDCQGERLRLTISDFSAPESRNPVPEPSTLSMLAIGAAGVVAARLRRKRD